MKNQKRGLSILGRSEDLKACESEMFDLIIIGGGITGAGIALDAASRGIKTLLLEKQDFAAGTSSRSTKLIHGGLRYLKQLEVNLVREVGQERSILHENAPHLVAPKKMLLPIVEKGSLGKNSTSLGLYVYDWLAGVEKNEKRSMHSKADTLELEPLVREDVVLGGGLYYEYQTDDARLVIEVLKTACDYGAKAFNYTEITDLTYSKGEINGVKVFDHLSKTNFQFKSKFVVNACGPWVDEVRHKDGPLGRKRLHLTKGVHIVVPYNRLPLQQACYFDVQDGRMIFAIPRGETTYIGTTDTTYHGTLERPVITSEDADYLLEAANFMFPTIHLEMEDIISSWSGLRPLIHQEGKSPSELSRKDEFFITPSGLISIAGGKLTGFRKMAERTVDIVVKELYKLEGRKIVECQTDGIKIGGGNFKKPNDIRIYTARLFKEWETSGIEHKSLKSLVNKYGKYTEAILEYFEQLKSSKLSISDRLIMAELEYGLNQESINNLSDFFIRRTGMLYFERPKIQNLISKVHKHINITLGHSKAEAKESLEEFMNEYHSVLAFAEVLSS